MSRLIVLALCASFAWALYPFFLKRLKVDEMVIWMSMTLMSAVFVTMMVAIFPKHRRALISIDRKTATYLMIATLIGPVFGVLMYMKALKASQEIAPTIAIAFTSPAFAVLLGYIFYNEQLSIPNVIGIAMIVAGVFIMNFFDVRK